MGRSALWLGAAALAAALAGCDAGSPVVETSRNGIVFRQVCLPGNCFTEAQLAERATLHCNGYARQAEPIEAGQDGFLADRISYRCLPSRYPPSPIVQSGPPLEPYTPPPISDTIFEDDLPGVRDPEPALPPSSGTSTDGTVPMDADQPDSGTPPT